MSTETYPTIFYPRYFSLNSTKVQGRRIPKNLAVINPTIQEIQQALKTLNIEVTVNPLKRYPRSAVEGWDIGSVSFKSDVSKESLLRQVGQILKQQRK